MIPAAQAHKAPVAAVLLTAGVVWSLACQPAQVREFTAGKAPVLHDWNQVFTERQIELQVPEPGPPLLRVAIVSVASQGDLIIPDGRAKRILVFSPDGALVREIRGGDEGSSFELSVMGTIALDSEDNLLIYDPDGRWVTVLAAPNYQVLRRFQIAAQAAVLLALSDGTIVTYSPADEKVFKKFDRRGKQIAAAHRVRNEELRIFHGRVQTGGITQDPSGDLFGLHPSAFELVRLSSDLEVLELLRGGEDDVWSPQPPDFPAGLNPYQYRPAHEEWWDSFTHIGRPYSLKRDLLLVTLFASRGLAETQDFANIYRLDGEVVAQGLRVPHGGRIVGTADGAVYVVRNAGLSDRDSIESLQFYEYRLRDRPR